MTHIADRIHALCCPTRAVVVLAATFAATQAPAQPAPSASAPEANPVTLPAVSVTGTRESSGTGATEGWLPLRASTGSSKLGLSVREQPNVIQIVPRELIEARGATSVHEAIGTVAGVRPVSPAYTSGSGGVRVRGFENQDVFFNGMRLGAFGHPLDTANIEQLEVLKGPASIQYGLTDPGGALNIVTKRPVAAPLARARAVVGSFDNHRAELDLGGSADADGRVLTRLNVAAEDAHGHRDFDRTKRWFIAPAASITLGPQTTWDVELSHLRNDHRFSRGLNPQPFILDLPVERSFGEPNQPLSRNDSTNVFSTLEHRLGNSGWVLRQRLAYLRVDSDSYEINTGIGGVDSAGNLSRSYLYSFGRDRFWTVQHEVAGEFATGTVRHKVVVGSEFAKTDFGYGFYGVTDPSREIPPLDVFAPSYGGYVFPGRDELSETSAPEHYGNRIAALYADWHAALSPQWKLLAGVRYDRTRGFYETLSRDVNYGASRSRGLSPRAGLVWTPITPLDLFVNYSTGFTPQIFADAAGTLFTDPEKSRQVEVGLRYDFVPGRLRGTAAAYRITKKNVQVPDPTDATGQRSRLSGEQQSSGLELELAGAITPQWNVSAGFARVNARVTEDTVGANIGNALVDAPRNHVTLFSRYKLGTVLPGAWVGYGLTRVSERVSSNGNPGFALPAYTRHDAVVGYETGPLTLQLNLNNLGDERIYYTHGNNIHRQPGREVKLSAAYRFY